MTLAISGDELRTLLSDNIHLVQGLFKTLAERSTVQARVIVKGTAPEEISRLTRTMTTESALAGERLLLKGAKGAEITRLAAGGLTPVQRVIMLGRIPLFSRISAEELLHLAAIATEVPLVNGNRLVGGADPSALYVVLSGALSLDAPAGSRNEAPLTVGPGDAIGIYETLAGVSLGRAVQAVRDGVALHITSDDLFDLLAHRSDLLKQLFGALFSTQDTATTPVGA